MNNAGVRDANACAVENPYITCDSPDTNSLPPTGSVTDNINSRPTHILHGICSTCCVLIVK